MTSSLKRSGQLGVTVTPVNCGQSGNRKAYILGGEDWKKKRGPKWAASGTKVEIGQREASYIKEKSASLEYEKYAPRLFNLHPGVEEEYRKAL